MLSRTARRLASGLWLAIGGLVAVTSVAGAEPTGGMLDPVACVSPAMLMLLAALPPEVIAELCARRLGIDLDRGADQ